MAEEGVSRTQYYAAATLDGYIADVGDRIDWLTGYEGTYEGEGSAESPMAEGGSYESFYEGVGAVVSGSVTYEFILGQLERGSEWQYAGKPCWILSSRKLPVPDGDGIDVRIATPPSRSCSTTC
jgi:dihydrofolate reductase